MISKEILEIAIPITQILILIILIIYVIKTWRISSASQAAAEVFALSLQVMKEARDQEGNYCLWLGGWTNLII